MKNWARATAAAVLMLCAVTLCLTACTSESKVGEWDPMKWKVVTPMANAKDGVYNVPSSGSTFSVVCRNYAGFWFSDIQVDGKYIEWDGKDIYQLDCEQFSAQIQGNKLTLDFKANESAQKRNITISVTAGDVFDTFCFKQLAQQK